MLHHGDYSNAGYPTVMRLFGRFSLQRLTFTWLLMTIATGYFMAIIFDIQSIVVALLLIVTSLLAFTSSLQLLKQSFELKDARKVFVQINLAFLAAVIFVSIDQYLKFNF
jgi:protoheme IX farnesyltransferase